MYFYKLNVAVRIMTETLIRNHLSHFEVAIAGCGGLGSNAAVALARSGIGKLLLVDFDRVELSNLNRQYFFYDQIGQYKAHALADNIRKIDRSIELKTIIVKLDETSVTQLFARVDLVIEAFDLAAEKQMLLETMLLNFPEKPLIMGNGMAGFGKFELIKQQQWDKQVYICGDFTNEISEDNPPLAPRVGIVANMQANLALELILKMRK
ncbi:MAG TPA: sulfur carrier protein ThiS adenylyltransferase ThiF [Bacteroidales bacterium]|nr:sulfur carrier protein ThiS adenylyltransferase ThiF [Bacteroidales bacterium]HPE43221.1 sulfur carrier protein ThiS adenylyltransferase ThiF [Bacteroidales bacterium]